MSNADHTATSPFKDPSVQSSQDEDDASLTLNVGRNASLTLGTDALIVLDEGVTAEGSSHCCGMIPGDNKPTRAIPFFNILWTELKELKLEIYYADSPIRDIVRVLTLQYITDKLNRLRVDQWMNKLLNRAYGESQMKKRIKVLINPFGGKGNAPKLFARDVEPIFTAARCAIDVEHTQYKGHAIEIAKNIDIEAFDVIASCSGDGLPHEVFNGLGQKPDAKRALFNVAVVQLPCGTGNAMSWNLNGTDSASFAALCIVKGLRTPLDLVSITQGETRTLSFLSQALGIIAESDLGTENLRWLGDARFTLGLLTRLLKKTVYPCDIAIKAVMDDKNEIREHYHLSRTARSSMGEHRRDPDSMKELDSQDEAGLPQLRYGTIKQKLPSDWELVPYNKLGNFYCGNMVFMAAKTPFFAATLPHDGFVDLVTIDGDISRSNTISLLLAVEKNKLFEMPLVHYRKILGYRIVPKGSKDGYISIDGERIPFAPFQAEVHPGLGTVLSRNGQSYEAQGVSSNGFV